MVAEMRNGHGRFSRDWAFFVEGLAYSGMRRVRRTGSSGGIWTLARGQIAVRGDSVTGTKGGEGWRRVPMI